MSCIFYIAIGTVPFEGNKDKVVEMLIKSGVDVKAENGHGETALHLAAKHGNFESLQQIESKMSIKNDLHIGFTGAVDLLIKNGANITHIDYKGKTPLHSAAFNGNNAYD